MHVVSTVLVPAAAFYSSVDALIASSPELSTTAEAYFLTRQLRESFAQPVAPVLPVAGKRKLLQQVPNLQLHGVQGGCLLPPHTRESVSVLRSQFNVAGYHHPTNIGRTAAQSGTPGPRNVRSRAAYCEWKQGNTSTLTGILRTTYHKQQPQSITPNPSNTSQSVYRIHPSTHDSPL